MSCVYLQDGGFFYNNENNNSGKQPDLLKKLVLVLILVLGALVGFSQEVERAEPSYCLKVKVKPTIDHKQATGVTMRLFKGEQELIRIDSTNESDETFMLEKNAQYTIEIASPGRLMRRVSFSTVMPDDVPIWPLFRYYMDVELPAKTPMVNDFYSDFPVAVVSYNEDKDKFEHSKQYTAQIKQLMQQPEEKEKATVGTTTTDKNSNTGE